jgi:hypothetical protein
MVIYVNVDGGAAGVRNWPQLFGVALFGSGYAGLGSLRGERFQTVTVPVQILPPKRAVFGASMGRHMPASAQAHSNTAPAALDANVPRVSCWTTRRTNISGPWRNILTTLSTLTETVTELGKGAKQSVEAMGRSAGKKLDDARDGTGHALHTAASSVRTTGHQSAEAIDNLTANAADRLDATASYVEDHDLRGMLRRFGRRHLAGSLVAAAAIGFLAGSALSRASHSENGRDQNA